MKLPTVLIPIALTALVGGCLGAPQPAGTANSFRFQIENGTLTGRFDPDVFSSKEVRQHLKTHCRPQVLSGYSKGKPDRRGLVPFRATCKRASQVPSGSVQVEKTPDGRIVATGRVS